MAQTKKDNIKKTEQDIEGPHWCVWFIIGGMLGFLGGFFITYQPYIGAYTPPYYSWGLICLAISIVFDVLCLRDLIAEAHIKALEVFYGKKRAIESQFANKFVEELKE